jgi:hypothetical protein
MLIYTNTNPLPSGDFSHVVTVGMVQDELARFPADWLVSGVGATDWEDNVGEVLPSGTAGDLPFRWVDPGSRSHADVVDLRTDPRGPGAHFQFLGMAIGNPTEATLFDMQDVPDVHARIREKINALQLNFAGIELEGDFGPVQSRVAYYWPRTGYDQQAPDYVAADHFHFIDYDGGQWRMAGMYTRKPELQPLSAGEQGLHLHGYSAGAMRGGHILSAAARDVRVTIWPLSQMVIRYGVLATTL